MPRGAVALMRGLDDDRTGIGVLDLATCEGIEYPAMRKIRPLIISLIVPGDPGLKVRKHRILSRSRGILVRFPGARPIVFQASLQARVEKNQLRAMAGCGLYQVSVAAFDDPTIVLRKEELQRRRNRFRRTLHGNLVGLPDDGVQVEVREALRQIQLLGERTLAGARIAEDQDSHELSDALLSRQPRRYMLLRHEGLGFVVVRSAGARWARSQHALDEWCFGLRIGGFVGRM